MEWKQLDSALIGTILAYSPYMFGNVDEEKKNGKKNGKKKKTGGKRRTTKLETLSPPRITHCLVMWAVGMRGSLFSTNCRG